MKSIKNFFALGSQSLVDLHHWIGAALKYKGIWTISVVCSDNLKLKGKTMKPKVSWLTIICYGLWIYPNPYLYFTKKMYFGPIDLFFTFLIWTFFLIPMDLSYVFLKLNIVHVIKWRLCENKHNKPIVYSVQLDF